jgi:hypothetical protein
MIEDLKQAIDKKQCKKASKILNEFVTKKDKAILSILYQLIDEDKIEDGLIICDIVKSYFRIKRNSLNDVEVIFEFPITDNVNIQESLLDVLGYDKMTPSINDQKRIIGKYFNFGDNTDYRYYTDPRYGLAAACAGWDKEIVKGFLNHCITTGDAPLKYVSQNSLKGKYVKLR